MKRNKLSLLNLLNLKPKLVTDDRANSTDKESSEIRPSSGTRKRLNASLRASESIKRRHKIDSIDGYQYSSPLTTKCRPYGELKPIADRILTISHILWNIVIPTIMDNHWCRYDLEEMIFIDDKGFDNIEMLTMGEVFFPLARLTINNVLNIEKLTVKLFARELVNPKCVKLKLPKILLMTLKTIDGFVATDFVSNNANFLKKIISYDIDVAIRIIHTFGIEKRDMVQLGVLVYMSNKSEFGDFKKFVETFGFDKRDILGRSHDCLQQAIESKRINTALWIIETYKSIGSNRREWLYHCMMRKMGSKDVNGVIAFIKQIGIKKDEIISTVDLEHEFVMQTRVYQAYDITIHDIMKSPILTAFWLSARALTSREILALLHAINIQPDEHGFKIVLDAIPKTTSASNKRFITTMAKLVFEKADIKAIMG